MKTLAERSVIEPERGSPLFDSVDGLLRELAREPEPTAPGAPPEPSLPAGTRIGRFELLREIGRGGLGVVYEAHDTTLGRSVAFKLVRGGQRTELRREHLVREAEAAARLSHPNVVTLFDLGSSEHGPYLVLELLRGNTLAARIRQGPIPARDALRIGIDIARGLAHAHENGVVHGDVTPGNVFLCHDERVKVLDLGLARMFGSSSSGGGTVGYMAPEQRTGAPPSTRTDVFGLGVVLFHMLRGRTPYRADDDTQRPRLRVDGAPALADAIERMIATDASDRPADASACVTLLTAALDEIDSRREVAAPRRRGTLHLAVGAVIVALVAGGLALRGRGGSGKPGPLGARSIAVLPFVDCSPEHDQQYLAEGVAEQVLSALSRSPSVHVIGRNSSFGVSREGGLEAAARALGATDLLVGSTRRDGDRLEVEAELRDGRGDLLWSKKYTRAMVDLFSLHDDIARSALAAVGATVPDRRVGPTPPKDPETYAEYLRGRQLYYRGTTGSWELAREAYERAVARDPGYAPAWAGLAMLLFVSNEVVGAGTDTELRQLRRRALEAAEKAVVLDPDLADARSVRGHLLAWTLGDWPRAMADEDRAVALEPNNVDALRRYSMLTAALGRIDDAIAAAEKAVALDPLSAGTWAALAEFYDSKGDLVAAERSARHALAISPDGVGGLLSLGTTLLLAARPQEALGAFGRCPEMLRLAGTAMAEHSLGHAERSRTALDTLAARHGHAGAYFVAQVHAWRGEPDQAFTWLGRAVANNENAAGGVRYDAILKRLEGDARWPDTLRKLGLPVY